MCELNLSKPKSLCGHESPEAKKLVDYYAKYHMPDEFASPEGTEDHDEAIDQGIYWAVLYGEIRREDEFIPWKRHAIATEQGRIRLDQLKQEGKID